MVLRLVISSQHLNDEELFLFRLVAHKSKDWKLQPLKFFNLPQSEESRDGYADLVLNSIMLVNQPKIIHSCF